MKQYLVKIEYHGLIESEITAVNAEQAYEKAVQYNESLSPADFVQQAEFYIVNDSEKEIK